MSGELYIIRDLEDSEYEFWHGTQIDILNYLNELKRDGDKQGLQGIKYKELLEHWQGSRGFKAGLDLIGLDATVVYHIEKEPIGSEKALRILAANMEQIGYKKIDSGMDMMSKEDYIHFLDPSNMSIITIQTGNQIDQEELWQLIGSDEEEVEREVKEALEKENLPCSDDDVAAEIEKEGDIYLSVIKELIK